MKYRLWHKLEMGSPALSDISSREMSPAGTRNSIFSIMRSLGRGFAMIMFRPEDDNEFPWWEFK